MTDPFHGKDVCEDGWGDNATYFDLERMIRDGEGWKELVFTSASDRWLEAVVFENYAADGTRTMTTKGREAQPGTWDRRIKERDGEDSGAYVEMWSCKEEGVWEKVEGNYDAELGNKAGQDHLAGKGEPLLSYVANEDDESDAERVRPSIQVRVRRGRGNEYVQDGRTVHDDKSSRELREMFEKLGWKEIKAREMFIPGAEEDPCAHL